MVIFLLVIQGPLWSQTSASVRADFLGRGLEQFNNGRYGEALDSFQAVLSDPSLAGQYGDAYFWIVKTQLALGRNADAEKTVEFFLMNYPKHQGYPEILYQKGRLLNLQEDYNGAIQVLYSFLEKYPGHPFAGNSYYWIGESLYAMGQFGDALKVFSIIVNKYPDSFKIDAAKYRISLIELKFREQELLKFLKWSHEETLKTLEEYKIREKTYEQALAVYQKKISEYADKGTEQKIQDLTMDLQEREKEIIALEDKVSAREEENGSLKKELEQAKAAVVTAGTATATAPPKESADVVTAGNKDVVTTLLQLKSDALDLKEYYVRWLTEKLER